MYLCMFLLNGEDKAYGQFQQFLQHADIEPQQHRLIETRIKSLASQHWSG